MTTSPTPSNEEQIAQPRDAAYWASQGLDVQSNKCS